jgi:formate dehydrogenase (coenzyme F420) beta subunit
MTSELEKKLRDEARDLLETGKIDRIVGYEAGSLKFSTTPLITSNKADVDRLVINPFIHNNLSVFLSDLCGKVGIVVKGCDARSAISLVQDKQIERKDVFLIGVPCCGVIDLAKVEKLTGLDRDEIDDLVLQGKKAVVTSGGKTREFEAKDVLTDACFACDPADFKDCDMMLGAAEPVFADKDLDRKEIKEMEAMTPAQRWEFWKNEFSRCIRCYGCRQVCPACFCDRCFVEETEPVWISPLPKWQDNLIFQVVRMMHVAGRCTDCGECERICPANIPLGKLTGKMEEIVEELFQYRAGTDKDAQPLMAAYKPDEVEDLMR